MAGVNKVILLGNLGKDPEAKFMQNGDPVCTLTIATSESWKDKATGEKREATEWHRVVAYRALAKIMDDWLHKGSKVYIEGKIRTRKWQDQNGQDRYSTEIIADQMQMLDARGQQSATETPAAPAPQDQGGHDDIPF